MATILLCWELGGGLGHLANLRPIARELHSRGHRVFAALRDLSIAREILDCDEISLLQAPFKHSGKRGIEPICTFAQVLHNIGFGRLAELTTMVHAWRQIFEWARPDLIIFEHSPSALLASQGLAARKAILGNGFYCPADVTPLPNLRTWEYADRSRLAADERHVLENVNAVAGLTGPPPFQRLAQLFAAVDENFLLTFPEIDCYRRPPNTKYWGAWSADVGKPPQWPPGDRAKIFGYLKPFPEIPGLLRELCRVPIPTLLYIPGLDPKTRADFRGDHIQYVDEPIEMSQVAQQCDLAILNGTSATATAMLLAGKPALHIPLFLEQAGNALRVQKLGAGLCASPTDPIPIIASLRTLLARDQYARRARDFAIKYKDFDPQHQIGQIVERLDCMANNG